jgi:hypothetical protein
MMSVSRVFVAIAIGTVTWIAVLFAALSVPGSPHAHAAAVMRQLAVPGAGPEAAAAFMALGRGVEWVDATVFTVLVAIVVSLTSGWLRMSRNELIAVLVAFAAFTVSRAGMANLGAPEIVAIGLFALVLAAGRRRRLT